MKEFYFRKHLRKPTKTFFCCLIYLLTFFLVFGITSNLSFNIKKSVIRNFNRLYFSGVLLVIVLIYCFFFLIYYLYLKSIKDKKVVLDDESISYYNGKKAIVIKYDNIKYVDCSHFKYSRGWIKIKDKDNKVIKLTVTLENIAIFIKEFKERLDEKNLYKVYNSKRMYDFYKTASYSDDSWERIYELLRFVPPCTGVGVVISFIFSFLVNELDIKLVIILLVQAFPVLVLLLSEAIFVIKHTIEMKNEEYIIRMRDYQYEHRVFDAVFVILFIMLMIVLFYFAMKY